MTDADRIARLRYHLTQVVNILDWRAAGRPVGPHTAAAAANDARAALAETAETVPEHPLLGR